MESLRRELKANNTRMTTSLVSDLDFDKGKKCSEAVAEYRDPLEYPEGHVEKGSNGSRIAEQIDNGHAGDNQLRERGTREPAECGGIRGQVGKD
jgi:hypothetical protein